MMRKGNLTSALAACAALAILFGCGQSSKAETAQGAAATPARDELSKALNTPYVSPVGSRHECLGRLVFDTPGTMQWGVRAPGAFNDNLWRFTETLHGDDDEVAVGDLGIVVMAPATGAALQRMVADQEAQKTNLTRDLQHKIDVNKGQVDDITAAMKGLAPEERQQSLDEIESIKKTIADAQSGIAQIAAQWKTIALGRPDSVGYAAGGELHAFIYGNGRVYRITSSPSVDSPPLARRKQAFLDAVQRFKLRDMYDIPPERGVCVPYGFLPDEGTTPFRISVSMRYADRPGVIYSITTGVVGRLGLKADEPTLVRATARAATGVLGGMSDDGARRTLKTIGPQRAMIGAIPANQGGVVLDVASKGQPVKPNYSVYTGFAGRPDSQVLPLIVLDMRSFTKEQDKSLKTDPPPFEESHARLNALLASIRLRPTTEPMPELVGQPH